VTIFSRSLYFIGVLKITYYLSSLYNWLLQDTSRSFYARSRIDHPQMLIKKAFILSRLELRVYLSLGSNIICFIITHEIDIK
jgi:hypothetical protein